MFVHVFGSPHLSASENALVQKEGPSTCACKSKNAKGQEWYMLNLIFLHCAHCAQLDCDNILFLPLL